MRLITGAPGGRGHSLLGSVATGCTSCSGGSGGEVDVRLEQPAGGRGRGLVVTTGDRPAERPQPVGVAGSEKLAELRIGVERGVERVQPEAVGDVAGAV